jgi:hypothetical protein
MGHRKVASAVKERVPGWTHGKPIPSDVLDEIFADESIMSMHENEGETARCRSLYHDPVFPGKEYVFYLDCIIKGNRFTLSVMVKS